MNISNWLHFKRFSAVTAVREANAKMRHVMATSESMSFPYITLDKNINNNTQADAIPTPPIVEAQ